MRRVSLKLLQSFGDEVDRLQRIHGLCEVAGGQQRPDLFGRQLGCDALAGNAGGVVLDGFDHARPQPGSRVGIEQQIFVRLRVAGHFEVVIKQSSESSVTLEGAVFIGMLKGVGSLPVSSQYTFFCLPTRTSMGTRAAKSSPTLLCVMVPLSLDPRQEYASFTAGMPVP